MGDLEFDKQLKKAITAQKRKEQKEYLQSLEASIDEPEQPSKKFNWRIAASIAVFISVGSYFFLFDQSPSNDELYNTYFSPYENVIEPIVRNQTSDTKKVRVFAFYEEGEYEKAIEGFDSFNSQDSLSTATINFYKANAHLQLKELIEAQTLFTEITTSTSNEWKEESLWYLALISLKLENSSSAVDYLQRLQKQKNQVFKKEEVKTLLNILD